MEILTQEQLAQQKYGLTFDDVLLVPVLSEVRSRRDPILQSKLTRNIEIDIPIISANMDSITEAGMAIAMQKMGAFGIIHRFMDINKQIEEVKKVKKEFENVSASIGVDDDYLARAEALVSNGANIITIDIAHGHSIAMIEVIKKLRSNFSPIEIIAGNVATPEGVNDLAEAGADAIKVGIGPGSMCTTRIVTGCGIPQLSAIALCSMAAEKKGIPIIADGGLRNSGDIIKAFAAGANSVMSGSLFAGILETPGKVKNGKKKYRGMASKAAQVSHHGGVPKGMAPEGESMLVAVQGHLYDDDNLPKIIGGIRSGMSYINATKFCEIKKNAGFVLMSYAGAIEARAHGIDRR